MSAELHYDIIFMDCVRLEEIRAILERWVSRPLAQIRGKAFT